MRYDIWKIALILSLGGIFGYVIGKALAGLILAAFGIIGWQLHRMQKLYRWIKSPNNYPMPESTGQLYLLHRELSRKARSSRLRKKQLTALFSQFRQAVSALPDAIVLIDAVGQIRWANNNAEHQLGIRWPADANLRLGNLVRDPKLHSLLSETSLKNDPNSSGIGVEIRSSHNSEHVINIKVIPYTDELRMVIGRDVTRLMKVNQMRTDFVANVSHELKTPLTVLRGYLELLDGNKKLDPSLQRPIQQMAVQTERMQLIVQDLLFLSKLEEPQELSTRESVDVTHLINTIVEMIQPKVKEHAHKLELDIDYDLKILGNQSELHSAFSNLILNAVNYTSTNGIIKVRWRRAEESSDAAFMVSDNGAGIAAQHIPRLTERFYRIDADRSRDGGGTGLGLAIVKHVLQRHEAVLEVDSVEGVGSTFTCIFPERRISSSSDMQRLADS